MKTRRAEILAATARCFRKLGYKATSMEDIANAVGIKAASIYNHFDATPKQIMLQELSMQIAEQFTKGMKDIKEAALTADQKLERIIALHIRLTVEHTDAIALVTGDWIHLEEPIKSDYLKLRNAYENDLKHILEAGKASQVIKNLNTDLLLYSLLSSLHWLYSWYSKNRNYNTIELEQQLTTCLLDGIRV
ncbi:MAG: TetR/AcrR family transcriptional regulator [Bacteroidota bacterium]